jgi:NAD(P)-dependent dehydrogenase (short-subunit alcohol dehydrogenase family)
MSVLVVTGSSRGIGAEICRQAAVEGWSVCVNYASSSQQAEKLVNEINQLGGNAISAKADVSDEAEVRSLFEQVDEQLGPTTGLVNCAGINGCGSRVDEMDSEKSKRLFEVHILGSFICAKYAIQRMAKRHGGSGGAIVNISSAASKHGGPFTYVDYAASKAAIDTFTIGLAREQADQGIRVNCIRPGITLTEISKNFATENPEWLDWVMKQVPLGRPAEVNEIANSVMYMLSSKSSYATGSILDVSGGWVSP